MVGFNPEISGARTSVVLKLEKKINMPVDREE